MMNMRTGVALIVVLAATLGTVTGTAPAGAAQLEQVGTFSQPVSVAAPPGDPQRVFVVERGGTIQELVDGVRQPQPFLDITSLVDSGGSDEEGLLSMAFAPDYATSHRFYVYYTGNAPTVPTTMDIEVDQLTAASPDHADPSTRLRVLTIAHHIQSNHNGGQLQFGPDGMLYIGTGDGGGGGDTQGNGQNLSTTDPAANRSPLLAKILRIDPQPGGGYTVPADNPFMAPAGEVWMYGLRNPWRFSFDRQTGDMIIGDVGQDKYEEVDFAPSPSPGVVGGRGADYGWNLREGLNAYSSSETPGPGCCTDPVIQETHSGDGWYAIIGGVVDRDPGLPELAGTYLFGDYVKGELFGASLSGTTATNVRDLGLAVPGLAGMGQDACGRVYMALLSGAVDRLVNDAGGYTCTAPLTVVPPPQPVVGVAPVVPAPVAGTDRTPPRISVSLSLRQRIAGLGRLVLHVGCDEHCTIGARGLLRVGPHSYATAATKTLVVAAAARVTVHLTLTRALRRRIDTALRRHFHPRIAVALRAVDAAGNVKTRHLSVAVSR